MDFPKVLDVYQLSDRAYSDYAVCKAKNPNTSVRELNEAERTMSSLRAGLDSLGFGHVPFEEVSERWTEVADLYGATLIRDDVFEAHWKDRMIDQGRLTRETVHFLEGHVDWKKVAADKGAMKLSFVYGAFPAERTYWLVRSS